MFHGDAEMDYEEEVSSFLQNELLAVSMNMALLDFLLLSDECKNDLGKRVQAITKYTVANMVYSFLCGKYGREKTIAYLNKELKTDDANINELFSREDRDWLNGIVQ